MTTMPWFSDPGGTLASQLDALLRESPGAAIERERAAFDRAAEPCEERVVLHGAGGFGRHLLTCMRGVGIEPVAFTDNNSVLHIGLLDGVLVCSPQKGAELYGKNASFLITVWNSSAIDRMAQRVQQLKGLGCERVFPVGLLCWKYPDAFLPYYPLDLPHKALLSKDEIRAAFDLFGDDASRKEYVGQLRFRLLLDYDGLGSSLGQDQYFKSDLYDLGPDEVLIDCGAFDGDTIAGFLRVHGERFKSIVAFEPDPPNWKKLEDRLDTLPATLRQKIRQLPLALGSSACSVQFNSTGTDVAKIGAGSVSVDCVTLDQTLRDTTPTFIKFDIEGAELDALDGALEVIPRSRPILAVSCYHRQSHLWEIPLKLAAMCSDYRFFLRPHGVEGWDLMCIAVPLERLKSH